MLHLLANQKKSLVGVGKHSEEGGTMTLKKGDLVRACNPSFRDIKESFGIIIEEREAFHKVKEFLVVWQKVRMKMWHVEGQITRASNDIEEG